MGLFQNLCRTYDTMMPGMDFSDKDHVPMAPVGHFVKWADVCIVLDATTGCMADAFVRQKEAKKKKDGTVLIQADKKIVMPVTEASLGRSSSAEQCPHPLCDYVHYMIPGNTVAYESYIGQLSKWAKSKWGDRKLDAVLAYVQKGTIVQDLASRGVLEVRDDGSPKNEKVTICWDIIGLDDQSGPCHEDVGLMEKYAAWYIDEMTVLRGEGLCMVTGKECLLADQHPKGVVPWYGNAKIIASKGGSKNVFTFRGRFLEDYEVLTVGYEASQKAHNTLAWLVSNQGVTVGDRLFVSWNPEGAELPKVTGCMMLMHDQGQVVPTEYRKQLKDSLNAWRKDMPDGAGVVFAVLDAATVGCLAVAYYNEMPGIEYLERFEYWEEYCCYDGFAPTLGSLAQYACGVPSDGDYKITDGMKGMQRAVMQRLVQCRLDNAPFPADVHGSLVQHASNLMMCASKGAKGAGPRQKLLRAACSAISKYRKDVKGEDWTMGLDRECRDRSYLYGRLLAVAERVERSTYRRDETREPMAMRFQMAMGQRPASTWRMISDSLAPYFSKLKPGSREFYRNEIAEIQGLMEVEENVAARNARLDDLYVLGYGHERAALYWSKGSAPETADDTDGEANADE